MHHDLHWLTANDVDQPDSSRNAAMHSCPKYDKCSANVCPLDPDWRQRSHDKYDRVCFYLLEAVKPGSEGRFKGDATEELRLGVLRPLPEIMSRWSAIGKQVERARTTGSRMDRRLPPRQA